MVPPIRLSSCHSGGACRLAHSAAARASRVTSSRPGPGSRGCQNRSDQSVSLRQRRAGRGGAVRGDSCGGNRHAGQKCEPTA